MKPKVILITGSSRGIGRLAALELAKRGHLVYGSMRNPEPFGEYPENLFVKQLDVIDRQTIDQVVAEVIEKQGRLDVVINNAGYGLLSPIEMATEEEIHKQFDVNVFGVIRVIQSALPHMRKQKKGHVINISSIAGVVSNPGLGLYCATKHALEAISASLAATIFSWNINVSVVQPAATATEFAEVMELGERVQGENPYGDFAHRYFDRMVNLLKEGQPPQEVAELIANIVETENPHFRYQTSPGGEELAKQFVVDPTGDQWVNNQKETFADWF